jgi:rhamnose utilization protein RhaD (predicted bifunctional aldolase and dehydrogenase)
VDIPSVLAIFNNTSLRILATVERESKIVELLQSACDDDMPTEVRPSVEATLHVILDKYVVHLHALAVLSYACAKDGKDKICELFKDEQYPPLWIPYADPGFALSHEVFKQTENYQKIHHRKPAIMILEKHGLLVADNTRQGVMSLVKKVISRCESKLKKYGDGDSISITKHRVELAKSCVRRSLKKIAGKNIALTHFMDKTVSDFMALENAETLLSIPALTPDEMGFIHKPVIWAEDAEYKTIVAKAGAIFSKDKKLPVGFLIKNIGLLILGDSKYAEITREVVVGSLFVRMNAEKLGGVNPLTLKQREFIENWEGEKFRVRLACQ